MMTTSTAALLGEAVAGCARFGKTAASHLTGNQPWSLFGIRDPSLLVNPQGEPIVDEAGRQTLFFNARDRALDHGGTTCVGMAYGNLVSGWSIQQQPVFVDSRYAAQGSVLRLAADHFRMYYSPDTQRGFALASSTDGLRWQRFDGGLILEPQPFNIRRMGLPYVRQIGDQWVMLFEGIDQGRFHIYVATSPDGIAWQAGNRGKPVYSPPNEAWDGFGQANPSLYTTRHGSDKPSYFILYNGCSELHGWDIGALRSDALEGPWRAAPAPLMCRGAPGEWDAGRVEGARLLEAPGRLPEIVYFGLPTADSYAGGRIAFASIESAPEVRIVPDTTGERNTAAERVYNDALASRYFDVWDSFPIQRFTTELESRLIDDVVAPGSRVILLGSGGGREMPVLLDKSCRLTAVDISPQMLAAGRRRYPDAEVTWVEADLHALPSDLVGFNVALCLGAVFNYLRDPGVFLARARQCVQPNGALILAVINAQHPSEAKAATVLSDGRIRRLYSVAELKTLLGSSGFEIASLSGVRFLVDLLPPAWNSQPEEQADGAAMLNRLLQEEAELARLLPAEKAKFILIHARAQAQASASAAGIGGRAC